MNIHSSGQKELVLQIRSKNLSKKHEYQLSAITMKENNHISTPFNIFKVTYKEIVKEVKTFDNKRPGTFSNISFKRLKEISGIYLIFKTMK